MPLAELDVRFVDRTVDAGGMRVRYAAPDGSALPTGRTALALLRAR